MSEPEKPQSGGQWGDFVAYALGLGLIIYLTQNMQIFCGLVPGLSVCG